MPKKLILPYKLLIGDIETSHIYGRFWRLGEQVMRHPQLLPNRNKTEILTISYKWFNEPEIYCLNYDTDPDMLEKFDAEVRKADVFLGKNSDSFDVKHLNTHRMLNNNIPLMEWKDTNDDLEKQLRKYFNFSSQSLDYISKLLGLGGKSKMEEQDWFDIEDYRHWKELIHRSDRTLSSYTQFNLGVYLYNKTPEKIIAKGKKALTKMMKYNKKDVSDTEQVLRRVLPYIQLRHNAATKQNHKGCVECGSLAIIPDKIIIKGQTKYQCFTCITHKGYAGKCTLSYDQFRNKRFGSMQK